MLLGRVCSFGEGALKFAEGAWTASHVAAESAREVGEVAEPSSLGDIGNRHAAVREQFARSVDTPPDQIFLERYSELLSECAAERKRIQAAMLCDIVERNPLVQVGVNEPYRP